MSNETLIGSVNKGNEAFFIADYLKKNNQCSLLYIARDEKEIFNFGIKAREGNITADQMNGATFTITNGGIYGSMMSTPILNPPQSGILGLHQIKDRAIVENGEIKIRPMMYVALTYDHRAVSGKEAVSFLVKIKEFIEDPDRMLIGL